MSRRPLESTGSEDRLARVQRGFASVSRQRARDILLLAAQLRPGDIAIAAALAFATVLIALWFAR